MQFRVGVKAAEHDLDRQLKRVHEVIETGQKVKIVLHFRRIDAHHVPKQQAIIATKCQQFAEIVEPGNLGKDASGMKSIMLAPLSSSEASQQ